METVFGVLQIGDRFKTSPLSSIVYTCTKQGSLLTSLTSNARGISEYSLIWFRYFSWDERIMVL